MTEPFIEATHVGKIYGDGSTRLVVLKDINLALDGGKLTVLMGPSGSGKTTLLSILGCMLAPTAGTVRVCGTSIGKAPSEERAKIRRQHLGFVFQSYHLFLTLTVAENVMLSLDVRGERGPRALAKTEAVLTSVGLASKMRSFPRQLSGGEQQRVAIARAIVAEPSAILADEPTASLDAANGRATTAILSAIAKERGRAVLVVTHDQRVFEFADRIIYIQDGVLARDEFAPAPRSTGAAADLIGKSVTCHGVPRGEHFGEQDGTEADSYIFNPKAERGPPPKQSCQPPLQPL